MTTYDDLNSLNTTMKTSIMIVDKHIDITKTKLGLVLKTLYEEV